MIDEVQERIIQAAFVGCDSVWRIPTIPKTQSSMLTISGSAKQRLVKVGWPVLFV